MSACALVLGAGLLVAAAGWTHQQVMTATEDAPQPWPTIVNLELAGDGQVMAGLLDRLGTEGIVSVRKALRIDLAIIVGYVALLGTLCLLSRETIRDASSGGLEAVGVVVAGVLAGAVLLAGLLDVVEDLALWSVLRRYRLQPVPAAPGEAEAAQRATTRRAAVGRIACPTRIAATAAAAKFLLLAVAVLWLFAVLVVILTRALA